MRTFVTGLIALFLGFGFSDNGLSQEDSKPEVEPLTYSIIATIIVRTPDPMKLAEYYEALGFVRGREIPGQGVVFYLENRQGSLEIIKMDPNTEPSGPKTSRTQQGVLGIFETDQLEGKNVKADYKDAIDDLGDMLTYNHSTVAVIEADLSKIKSSDNGHLSVKIATSYEDPAAIEADDFLAELENRWLTIDATAGGLSYLDMPLKVKINPGETAKVNLTKGEGEGDLLVLFPMNKSVFSSSLKDRQLEIPDPRFLEE